MRWREMAEENRDGAEREEKERIDDRRRGRGKMEGWGGEMLWATKQLISLNLGTLHNATAHYCPIRHYNALLTEVY